MKIGGELRQDGRFASPSMPAHLTLPPPPPESSVDVRPLSNRKPAVAGSISLAESTAELITLVTNDCGVRPGPIISSRLDSLHTLSTAIGAKVLIYTSKTGDGIWCVVARSEAAAEAHRSQIETIDSFSRRIDPERLPGACVYVHEWAVVSGISGGIASADLNLKGPRIYKNMGTHQIGSIDSPSQSSSLYFDLTARAYVFTPLGCSPKSCYALGLIVIEAAEETAALSKLYGCTWKRSKVPDHLLSGESFYVNQFGVA